MLLQLRVIGEHVTRQYFLKIINEEIRNQPIRILQLFGSL